MSRIPGVGLERLKKEIAIERLVMGFGVELRRHGAELIGRGPPPSCGRVAARKKGTTPKLDAPVSADADDQEALKQAVAFYPATLKQSPESRQGTRRQDGRSIVWCCL